jgi:hypothetical protein
MLCLITYRRLAQGILFVSSLSPYLSSFGAAFTPWIVSLMSRTESILNIYSIAQCTKFPFQRVFICPNRTLDKRVMSVLLRRWNLSWNFRTRNAQCFLHNSSHGWVFKLIGSWCVGMVTWWSFWISHFLCLYTSGQALKLMKTAASIAGFEEVDALSCNSFRHDFSFHYSSLVYMVSENRAFSRHVLLQGH